MKFLVKSFFSVLVFFTVFSTVLSVAQTKGNETPTVEFNPGPNPSIPMGRAVIDLYAELPEYMDISTAVTGASKFRDIFGLMMTRTYFDSNEVKILFIGQDATHIAEAAKQPGTSGFGARVQSIGNFFGVDQGIATTNDFMSTIKGQYGAFDSLYVERDSSGASHIRQSSFVDNDLWMLANGRDSEILIKREAFWEWMIKNNPDALGMIVTFGGAARDGFAEFLKARGAKVGTKMDPDRLKNIQVPETKLVFAGGNNEFPVPVNKDGEDIYAILLKGKLKTGQMKGGKPDYSKPDVQAAAIAAVNEAGQKAVDMMVFTGGGLYGSGVVNPAQLGGYDLDNVEINGEKINSLKGLVLSDGTKVDRDIAFAMSVHPSMLSKMTPQAASAALKKSFSSLLKVKKERNWVIPPDRNDDGTLRHNNWDEGKDYSYGRADIRAGYFEIGAPDDRRVSAANASRLDPQTIIAGTRDGATFDKDLLDAAKKSVPSETPNPNDLWSVRPRQKNTRYIFDRGPEKDIAKIMLTTIDRKLLFEPKPGMKVLDKAGKDVTFDTKGIDAYYTKTHPGTGLFGFHRGPFDTSRALILADPQGMDDWITSRAMTGARGQYLNGLMRDLGYGENYLVLKTVPVGMDGATAEEWEVVRQRTTTYREQLIQRALKSGTVERIFTDGDVAKFEMERILKKLGVSNIQVVNIKRTANDLSSGIAEAGAALGVKATPKMADIPRSHLTWWSRLWEGTGGDHVLDAQGKGRGGVRALVAPNWVANQKIPPSPATAASIQKIKNSLETQGLRVGTETVPDFLKRRGLDGSFSEAVANQTEGNGSAKVIRGLFTVNKSSTAGGLNAAGCGRLLRAVRR